MAGKLSSGAFSCCVCRELLEKGVRVTPCGHSLHLACIEKSFQIIPSCPACKKSFTLDQLNPNYDLEQAVGSICWPQTVFETEQTDEPFQVFILSLDGKIFPIEVKQSTKVADVKVKIQEKRNLAVESQRLIFGGKELLDNSTIKDNGISKDCSLHVVFRLRGG